VAKLRLRILKWFKNGKTVPSINEDRQLTIQDVRSFLDPSYGASRNILIQDLIMRRFIFQHSCPFCWKTARNKTDFLYERTWKNQDKKERNLLISSCTQKLISRYVTKIRTHCGDSSWISGGAGQCHEMGVPEILPSVGQTPSTFHKIPR
jgi:hypothetical protein